MRLSTLLPVFFATATIAADNASPPEWELVLYPGANSTECKSKPGHPTHTIAKDTGPQKCANISSGDHYKFKGDPEHWHVTFYKGAARTIDGLDCLDPLPKNLVKNDCTREAAGYTVSF